MSVLHTVLLLTPRRLSKMTPYYTELDSVDPNILKQNTRWPTLLELKQAVQSVDGNEGICWRYSGGIVNIGCGSEAVSLYMMTPYPETQEDTAKFYIRGYLSPIIEPVLSALVPFCGHFVVILTSDGEIEFTTAMG